MDYSIISAMIANYYVNLLIIQYHNKPKAKATIYLLAALIFANMTLLQIRDGFDWRTAQGVALDIIGKWVGIDRFYNGQFFYFHPWFSLINWDSEPDGLQGGFSTFSTFDEKDGGFLTYDDILPTQNRLSDDGFRLMIGLKIIKNSIKHSAKEIDNAIWDYFEGRVYTLWQGKTLVYYFPHELSEVISVAKYKNVLPRPTGVEIILKEIIDEQ